MRASAGRKPTLAPVGEGIEAVEEESDAPVPGESDATAPSPSSAKNMTSSLLKYLDPRRPSRESSRASAAASSRGGRNRHGSSGAASLSGSDNDEQQQQQQQRPRGRRHWWDASPGALDFMLQLLESKFWRLTIIFHTFVLLFGTQIQELWIPKEGDIVCDIIYCLSFTVFLSDIVMRLYVDPQYFVRRGCRCRHAGPSGLCAIGSFLFWCDLISTATLLYDISFINRSLLEVSKIDLEVNSIGMPVEGMDDINRRVPIGTTPDLLILIARSARVARFIRASTVVKTKSWFNWNWVFKVTNPYFYIEKVSGKRQEPQSGTGNTGSSRSVATDQGRDAGTTRTNTPPKRGLMRTGSWGGLQLRISAAARSRQKEEQKTGFQAGVIKALRFLGILRNDNEEIRREIAAIKIQRFWRAKVAREDEDESLGEDVAWSSQRQLDLPVERVMHKKSILRTYQQLNYTSRSLDKNRTRIVSHTIKRASGVTSSRRRRESQVGSAMRELTGQRVAIGIILALVLTVIFTYTEQDATSASTMIVLHGQTEWEQFAEDAIEAARESSIPDLFRYQYASGIEANYVPLTDENPEDLRKREIQQITIQGPEGLKTVGYFAIREERMREALVEIFAILFILLVWYFGVTAFAGPVMMLVVIPIERMVRLLGMLMMDPLGYQGTSRYKKFVDEEDELTKHTRWTKEVLKGMETSFLMSTILRIGSLMKVGFGSAGVEIIRNNLEKGHSENMLILNSQGSTVSCIFLFCDIRQFTDATECLQEEVFVFTNRIAAVVHSICHSYGGSANKNIGDAFLLSWSLEDGSRNNTDRASITHEISSRSNSTDTFTAKNNQADKALLSVVKILIALHHDNYYIETLSETAREALLKKLSKRKGPVVQLGFGLHAGKAVQGAIGSQRKIDATYVSEAVERAEFLESSTKKYGLKMLMSDSFHRLLNQSNRRRCRKIDQILLKNEDEDDAEDSVITGDMLMELFTFDLDIDALFRSPAGSGDGGSEDSSVVSDKSQRRLNPARRRRSVFRQQKAASAGAEGGDELRLQSVNSDPNAAVSASAMSGGSIEMPDEGTPGSNVPELVLPTGPALYNANVWLSDDMRRIREVYSDGLFFQRFNSGFLAYYARDWEHARQCFQTILERFDDGPSRYFLRCIEEHDGVPPRNFQPYGTA